MVLAPEKSQKHVAGLWLEEVKHSCIACTHTETAEEEERLQFRCQLLPTALWLPAEEAHATGGHEGKEGSPEPPPGAGGQTGAPPAVTHIGWQGSGWKEAAALFAEAPSLWAVRAVHLQECEGCQCLGVSRRGLWREAGTAHSRFQTVLSGSTGPWVPAELSSSGWPSWGVASCSTSHLKLTSERCELRRTFPMYLYRREGKVLVGCVVRISVALTGSKKIQGWFGV